jgi:hypothetical protein
MEKIFKSHLKVSSAKFHKLTFNSIIICILLLKLCTGANAQGNFYSRITLPWQGAGLYVKSLSPFFSPDKYTMYCQGTGPADSSIVLIKSGPTGQMLSARVVYGQPFSFATNQLANIQFTGDSMLTAFFATLTSPVILKFDTSLALLSAKSFASQPVYMNRLIEIDGYLIGVGSTIYQSIPSGAVCRMDLEGNVVSTHVFYNGDSARRAGFESACKSADGGFLFAGEHSYMNGATPVKLVLVKTDSLMNVTWQHHYCLDTTVTGYNLHTISMLELPGNSFMLLVNNSVNSNSGFLVIDSAGNVKSYSTFRYGSGSTSTKPFLFGLNYLPDSTIISAGQIDVGTSPYNLPVLLHIDTTVTLLDVKFGNMANTNINYVSDARYKPESGLLFSFDRILMGSSNVLETLQTDSLFNFPCGSNNYSIQKVSYTLFDSIFNYNFVPVSRSTSDITSQVHTVPVNPAQTFYCATSLPDEENQPLIQCYPNPANDHFILRLSDGSGIYGKLKITDISGKELNVLSLKNNKNEWLISTSNLANGIYLVEFRTDGNIPAWFKMAVNH